MLLREIFSLLLTSSRTRPEMRFYTSPLSTTNSKFVGTRNAVPQHLSVHIPTPFAQPLSCFASA